MLPEYNIQKVRGDLAAPLLKHDAPLSKVPDIIENLEMDENSVVPTEFSLFKSKFTPLLSNSTTAPPSKDAIYSKDFNLWATVAWKCDMMRIAEWEHQVAQTSLCEDAISIIRLCVQHFYGKDYVFESNQDMNFSINNEDWTLTPRFALGFTKTNIPAGAQAQYSIGAAYLPFLIGVEVKEEEQAEVELALMLCGLMNYHISCQSPISFVVGVVLKGPSLVFHALTKTDTAQHQFQTFMAKCMDNFNSTVEICQVIFNLKKLVGGFNTPTPAQPSNEALEPVAHAEEEREYKKEVLIYKTDYTQIFKALNVKSDRWVVLKESHVNDFHLLHRLGGKHHTVKLLDQFTKEIDGSTVYCSVYDFIEHKEPSTRTELKLYMRHLLQALAHCHKNQIIHRDVKQGNILRDNRTGETTLIDFGAAIVTGEPQYIYAGTDGYYAPEIDESNGLFNYSYAHDMWSAGVVLLELMVGLDRKHRDHQAVIQIKEEAKESFLNDPQYSEHHLLYCSEGADLLDQMLELNRWKRISAQMALGHEYFYN